VERVARMTATRNTYKILIERAGYDENFAIWGRVWSMDVCEQSVCT